ncbi:MAG: mandelate racemase/muconate lactonizing enzyme family protein [Thaumarchaeota archaeon]|nr:mandelate racemase/muconate lactonizing enzyme family protein [Nitrososphaerota archaeon]
MKVESIEAFPMRIKAREKLRGGSFNYSHYQTVLVKVTSDGEEGWGEAMTRFDPAASARIVRFLSKSILGKSFPEVKSAWNQVWRELRVRGHTRGIGVEALSGIEIALYDCLGKQEGKSVGELLSRRPAKKVKVFAGSLFRSRGALGDQVQEAKARGLMGAKVKIGFGVEEDSATLAAVRKAWPEGMIVADANGAYDGATATRACRAFEGFGLSWFEEPVLSDDWEGYKALKKSKVPIGAGESWFPNDFDGPISEKLVAVLEPSVSRCGGIGIEAWVGDNARRAKMGFSPMTGLNSAISLAASLQVAAAFPSLGVEYNPFANPLQSDLVEELPEPKAGLMRVPGSPGLGVEVDERFVKSHSG